MMEDFVRAAVREWNADALGKADADARHAARKGDHIRVELRDRDASRYLRNLARLDRP